MATRARLARAGPNSHSSRPCIMLRPRAFANYTLLVLLLLVPSRAMAQVEAPPPMDEELDRWDFTLDLGFNGSRGNTRLTVLTSGFRVKHLQTDLFELELGG